MFERILVVYSDIEPTSFTDSPFNFTFNNRALGFKRLFQQNPSVNVQINDIKQLPIIIPTKSLASSIELWADKAIKKKQESANENLEPIEVEIEDLIKILYSI